MQQKINFGQFQAGGLGEIVNQQVSSMSEAIKSGGGDSRIWKPSSGRNGEPNVVIFRFVPTCHLSEKLDKNGKPMMFSLVKAINHKLKQGNQSIDIVCPAQSKYNGIVSEWPPCPICESIKDGYEAPANSPEKKEYEEKKRKMRAYANVYIYQDSLNPSNNGLVKVIEMNNSKTYFPVLQKYFEGIKDKAGNYMEKPKPLFDMIKGHDIKMIITKDGDYSSYGVELLPAAPFAQNNLELIEKVFGQTYDLYEFIHDKHIKTPEQINEALNKFYGSSSGKIQENVTHFNAALSVAANEAKEAGISEMQNIPDVKKSAGTVSFESEQKIPNVSNVNMPGSSIPNVSNVNMPGSSVLNEGKEATKTAPADDFDPAKFFEN